MARFLRACGSWWKACDDARRCDGGERLAGYRDNVPGTMSPPQRTAQGVGCALGSHMPTVGEDYLPLHEMSTDSKLTT